MSGSPMAREMMPSISRVICCWQPTAAGSGEDSEVKTAADQLGLAAHGPQRAVEDVEDAVGRVVAPGRVLADAGVEQLDPVHERGGQQVVLAREVAVHRAHGDVGPGGHVAHLDRLVAALEPQRHGGVDHALAPGLLGAGERAGQRLLHPDSVSAPPPGSSGSGAATLAPPCQDGVPGGGRHRRPRRVRRAGGDDRRAGARRAGAPDPPAPARRHGRAARDHLVAVGQGHRHRPAGPDLAGDLLPVLRQRRAGHPGAGRGDGGPGGPAGRAGRRRLVRGGELGHRAGGDRGLPRPTGRTTAPCSGWSTWRPRRATGSCAASGCGRSTP